MSLYNEMLEAAADALHQHGDLNYLIQTRQTDSWRDCARADAHEGAGKRVVDAILDIMAASAMQVRAEAKAAVARIRREGEKPVSIRWCEQHRSTADPREGDCHWTQYQLTLPGDRAPALCVISPRQLAEEEA